MQTGQVLVVDDDPSICQMLDAILREEARLRVLCAGCRQEALDVLNDERPGIVLVEVAPRHDSLDLVRHMKSDPELALLPVLAFGYGRDGLRTALKAGCDGWLEKPFEVDELLTAVRRHLQA